MLARVTSPRCLVVVFAVLMAVYLGGQLDSVVNRGDGLMEDNGLPVGTDFAVFYAAGRMVAEGDGDHLYDAARIRSEFSTFLNTDKYYMAFPYPVWVALPYAALAQLPYVWAYV